MTLQVKDVSSHQAGHLEPTEVLWTSKQSGSPHSVPISQDIIQQLLKHFPANWGTQKSPFPLSGTKFMTSHNLRPEGMFSCGVKESIQAPHKIMGFLKE